MSEDQRYLSEGFIVTEKKRYVGLGTGDQLVRAVTEARIEAARHANPLTSLPGNIPINIHRAPARQRRRLCCLLCRPEQLQGVQRPLRLLARRLK